MGMPGNYDAADFRVGDAKQKPKPEDFNQLPRYRSHKIVRAAKIAAIDFGERLDLMPVGGVIEVGKQWITEKHAHVGGYFVVYEDGYTSFSPAKAFEDGYVMVTE